MRLSRPSIPLSIRLQVALGQLRELLGAELELHHRPALLNRERDGNDYIPRANDPDYLVYLPKDDHDIETRVRGQRGQHSDLGLARKRKRKERKSKRRKTKWSSRPLRSANRWPKKKLRGD